MKLKASLMLSDTEFERRKPVWSAFSEFWLDTELEDYELRRIPSIAKASGYSIEELRDIYLYEVASVVYHNLLCVAGVWTGFDEQWLHKEARKCAARRRNRLWVFSGVWRKLMTYATEPLWHQVVALLATPAEATTPPVERDDGSRSSGTPGGAP